MYIKKLSLQNFRNYDFASLVTYRITGEVARKYVEMYGIE